MTQLVLIFAADETIEWITSPIMQLGFAGLSIILLGIIVWLIRELLKVLRQNNIVITENTAAIRALTNRAEGDRKLLREIHDKLLLILAKE